MTERTRRTSSPDPNKMKLSPGTSSDAIQSVEEAKRNSEDSTPLSSVDQPQNQENLAGQDTLTNIETLLENNPTEFNASMTDATPKKIDLLSRDHTNKIIRLFAEKSNCTVSLAVIGISALVQGGGTNASMPPITRVLNGKRFELKTLRDCVAFATEKKGTVRQLAKTMRNFIYKIALKNGWLGPLATALQKE